MNKSFALILVVSLASLQNAASTQQQLREADCTPQGNIRFVCNQLGPEDLVVVPDSHWVIASSYSAPGGIQLINSISGISRQLFPNSAALMRSERTMYAGCPGPPTDSDSNGFRTHGLYLKRVRAAIHRLYAIHHGARESVEIFDVDTKPPVPVITWIGCVIAPDSVDLNAVVALPDGGVVASNFDPPRSDTRRGFSAALLAGEKNGELWEWHSHSSWTKVPGSESSGANGLELSPDGRWYYIAEWGSGTFTRLSRGKTPVDRTTIDLGFRPDNVRWSQGGTLLVAGQGTEGAFRPNRETAANASRLTMSRVGRIDPRSMVYQQLLAYPVTPSVSFATIAVRVGSELWVGSARGDRIVRFSTDAIRTLSK